MEIFLDEGLNRAIHLDGDVVVIKAEGGTRRLPQEFAVTSIRFAAEAGSVIVEKVTTDSLKEFVNRHLVPLINRGSIGEFSAVREDLLPKLGVSRGITLVHPALPDQLIRVSGIGVVTQIKDMGYLVKPPDPDQTVRAYAQKRGWEIGMATSIVLGNGQMDQRANNAILGAYVFGTEKSLKRAPNGVETVLRKVQVSQLLREKMQGRVAIPEIVAYGKHADIRGAGWLAYVMPKIVRPLEVFALSKQLEGEFLYQRQAYQLAYALGTIHREQQITHGQPHLDNWGVVASTDTEAPIFIGDWGTAVRFSGYPQQRESEQVLSPYEMSMYLDAQKAIYAAVSPFFKENLSMGVFQEIALTVAYGLDGYFQVEDSERIEFVTTVYTRFLTQLNSTVESEKKKPTFEIISVLGKFINSFMYDAFVTPPAQSKHTEHLKST